MRKKQMMKRALQATAVVLALGLAATASAGEQKAPKVIKKTEVQVPVNRGGLVAGVDPATGKVRQPTAEEIQALSEAMNKMFSRSAASVTVTEYSDGMISAELGDAFQNMTLVRINPDGSKSEACVEGLEQALEFFAVAPRPLYEEK